MNIIGINFYFHDSTACIVQDGILTVAIEEERLTRQKHTSEFPRRSVRRCLEIAKLKPQDIHYLAVSISPGRHRGKKILYGLRGVRHLRPFLKHELLGALWKRKVFWNWFLETWPKEISRPKVHFVEHHLSHIVGSFYVSPYEEAALLSLDGSGEWSTSWLGTGDKTTVQQISESFFPMSMGAVYEAATEFCGFRPNYDEGKTMGLAPFGDPKVFRPTVERILEVDSEGKIFVDLDYFSYQYWGYTRCSPRFHETFGAPRNPSANFEENHRNVAAAFQCVLEERALEMCRILRDRTNADHLVIAGGVGLNSVMNGRIVRESGFRDVYIMPAAGDNGTAIGAAYCVFNGILGNERRFVHADPYVGTEFSDERIREMLCECKLPAEPHPDVVAATARLLADGKIVGWFQGRMEIGPRALGNRSILANPTLPTMKDKINAEVKHREAYRPFAPAVPEEERFRYFESEVPAPFMLKVCSVRPEMRDVLPAITHVDGSARLQTVSKDVNPLFHGLLSSFGEITGVPVLLNTSFNVQGEPIVESPIDAIRCFYSTGLDALVLGNYIIQKKDPYRD